MVDVRGNNGATGSHFLAHKLRGDVFRQLCTEAMASVLLSQHVADNALAAHILAQRDKLHFRRDNALTRVVELGDAASRFRAPGLRQLIETQMIEPVVCQTLLRIARAGVLQRFAIVARGNPVGAQLRQAALDVDNGIGIAIGASGIVNRHRLILFIARLVFIAAEQRWTELDFPHRHANIVPAALDPDTFRVGKGDAALKRIDKRLRLSTLFTTGGFGHRHSNFPVERGTLLVRSSEGVTETAGKKRQRTDDVYSCSLRRY